jgi:hypothetical protein
MPAHIIFSSDWPTIKVADSSAAFDCAFDLDAFEKGNMTATAFEERWGQHPSADWSIEVEAKPVSIAPPSAKE